MPILCDKCNKNVTQEEAQYMAHKLLCAGCYNTAFKLVQDWVNKSEEK